MANVIGARARKQRGADAIDLCRLISARCADHLVASWTPVSTDIADLVAKDLAVAPDAADYP